MLRAQSGVQVVEHWWGGIEGGSGRRDSAVSPLRAHREFLHQSRAVFSLWRASKETVSPWAEPWAGVSSPGASFIRGQTETPAEPTGALGGERAN